MGFIDDRHDGQFTVASLESGRWVYWDTPIPGPVSHIYVNSKGTIFLFRDENNPLLRTRIMIGSSRGWIDLGNPLDTPVEAVDFATFHISTGP